MGRAEFERERRRARRFFRLVAPGFRLLDPVLLRHYRRTLSRLDLDPALDALDLGTGSGAFARALVERGHAVTGIDVVPRLLRRAQRHLPDARFVAMDLVRLPSLPAQSFDLVTAAHVLHGLPSGLGDRVLGDMARLARERVLVYDYPNRPGPWYVRLVERLEGPHYREHVRRPMPERLVAAGLELLEYVEDRIGAAWLARPSAGGERPQSASR